VPPCPPRGVRSYDESVLAAAYVRVSSKSQDDRSQRSAVELAARARGDEVTLWFAEKASATNNARPELERLREAARRGELRRLYVFRVDRLTRTGIRDTLAIVDELRRHGCELVSVADGFDLAGPAAEIVLAVMAWAAKMELAALGERISAARARAEAAGKKWGRPARVTPAQVAEVKRWRVAGDSIRDISVRMKIPKATVARVVSQIGAYGPAAGGREKPGVKKADPRPSH
jgi:DNA invertase Pin-like site-specific DNA recombinase